jgi:hypothetical protein
MQENTVLKMTLTSTVLPEKKIYEGLGVDRNIS